MFDLLYSFWHRLASKNASGELSCLKIDADKKRLGHKGEKLARRFLQKKGYKHLYSNYVTRQGEIDLIMQQNQTLVFVEVKARRQEDFARGEEAVNYRKQKHIAAAARHFIHANNLHHLPCRCDVVVVIMSGKGKAIIRHQEKAFTV